MQCWWQFCHLNENKFYFMYKFLVFFVNLVMAKGSIMLLANICHSVSERTFPSGSLNHATFEPPGDVQTPKLSWSRNLYFSQIMPFLFNDFIVEAMSATFHPNTVNS